jgi:protein-S-isoprenylcysteine O-methyltransferase Ste14
MMVLLILLLLVCCLSIRKKRKEECYLADRFRAKYRVQKRWASLIRKQIKKQLSAD